VIAPTRSFSWAGVSQLALVECHGGLDHLRAVEVGDGQLAACAAHGDDQLRVVEELRHRGGEALGVVEGQTNPDLWSTTVSRQPGVSVVMIGAPAAAASISVRVNPSAGTRVSSRARRSAGWIARCGWSAQPSGFDDRGEGRQEPDYAGLEPVVRRGQGTGHQGVQDDTR
jgi:hypothetical protein